MPRKKRAYARKETPPGVSGFLHGYDAQRRNRRPETATEESEQFFAGERVADATSSIIFADDHGLEYPLQFSVISPNGIELAGSIEDESSRPTIILNNGSLTLPSHVVVVDARGTRELRDVSKNGTYPEGGL